MIDELAHLLDSDGDRAQFMDWDTSGLSRKILTLSLCFLLISSVAISGVGPLNVVSDAEAASNSIEWQENAGGLVLGLTYDTNRDNVIAITENPGYLISYNSDGTEEWNISLSDNYPSDSIAYNRDSDLVFIGEDNTLRALHASNGTEKWSDSVRTFQIHSIVVNEKNDTVFATGSDTDYKDIYKYNTTGRIKRNSYTVVTEDIAFSESREMIFVHGSSNHAGVNTDLSQEWSNADSAGYPGDMDTLNGDLIQIAAANDTLERYDGSGDTGTKWYKSGSYQSGHGLDTSSQTELIYTAGVTDGSVLETRYINGSLKWDVSIGTKIRDTVVGRSDSNLPVYVAGKDNTVTKVSTQESSSSPISGTVTDSSGNQIDQADVRIEDSGGATVFDSTTDASGAWSTDLGDGDYTLHASKSKYHSTSKSFSVSGSSVTVDATIETQEVRGSIEDSNGNLLSNASVEIKNKSTGTILFDQTVDQTYAKQVADGDYWVNVSKTDFRTNSTTASLTSGENTDEINDVVLRHNPTVSGVVTDQNGNPASNATVEVVGVDTSTLNLSAGETKQQKADELLSEAQNPLPDSWNPDRQLTGNDGAYEQSSTEVVAIHSPDEWGNKRYSDGVDLGDPKLNPAEGEEFVLSVWNPEASGSGIFRDDADSDLPGKTVNRSVVVEELDHAGGVVDTETYDLNEKRKVGVGPTAKKHKIKTISLPAGVYRLSPEGSKFSLVVVVGDPSELRKTFATDLENKANKLTEAAEDLQKKYDSGKFVRKTATTNETGHYSVTVAPNVERVAVSAYKIDGTVLPKKENPTPQDLRNHVMSTDYNGSVYFSTEPKRFSPTTAQADVTVRKFSSPPYQLLGEWASKWSAYRDRLTNGTLTELGSIYNVPLSEWDKSQLEDGAQNLSDVMTDDMIDKWEEKTGKDWQKYQNQLENQERTTEQLRDDIGAMEETIESLQNTLEETESESELENETAVFRQIYDGDFEKGDVTATWHDFNGSVRPISDEYVTVDKRAGRGDELVVEYPIPNGSAGGTISALVIDEDGDKGSGRSDPIKNPDFSGDVPDLRSLDLSTIQPGPGETVTIDPNFASAGVELEQIEVFDPDGSTQNATLVGPDRARFTPGEKGEHVVRLTFNTSTGDGGPFVETIRVQALESSNDYGPRVQVVDGNLGVTAVAGSNVDDAEITIEQSGGKLDVTGMVEPDSGVNEVHFYLESAPKATDQTITTRVVSGKSITTATSLSRRVGVYVHGRDLSNDAVVYRKADGSKQPIAVDESTKGGEIADDENGGMVIQSYSAKNSEATFEVNNDPGRLEQLRFDFDLWSSDFPVLAIGVPSIPVDAVGDTLEVLVGELVSLATDAGPIGAVAYPQTEVIA